MDDLFLTPPPKPHQRPHKLGTPDAQVHTQTNIRIAGRNSSVAPNCHFFSSVSFASVGLVMYAPVGWDVLFTDVFYASLRFTHSVCSCPKGNMKAVCS